MIEGLMTRERLEKLRTAYNSLELDYADAAELFAEIDRLRAVVATLEERKSLRGA